MTVQPIIHLLYPSPAILIKTDGRLGAGAARNLGAKKSTGDFLLFTDVDVITPSNWIEKTISVINEKMFDAEVEDIVVQ